MRSNKLVRLLKSFFAHPFTFLRAHLSRAFDPRGIKRWSKESNLLTEWDERTKLIASMIEPGSSVLEFGCGRRILETLLPPDCTYQPSDLVDRGPNTLVCDLNQSLPNLSRNYTVAVFSGVLEYIHDLEPLCQLLANHCERVIASYSSHEECPDYLTRIINGWVNDYDKDAFIALFSKYGFMLERQQAWSNQTIYAFRRRNSFRCLNERGSSDEPVASNSSENHPRP